MADAGGEKNRIIQLDGLRAIAIVMVLLNHLFLVKLMWAGVDLFFVLSGFLITGILVNMKQSSMRDYFSHFFCRRARRILPPYLLLLVLTVLFYGLWWLRWGYMYVFLMNMLQPWMAQPRSLNVLWSLAVEEQFYLFWPIAVYLLQEKAIAWLSAAVMVMAPFLRYLCTPYVSYDAIFSGTEFRMDLLATGALMAIVWRRRRSIIERYGVYGPVLTVVAGIAILWLSRNPSFSLRANRPFANLWIYELTLFCSAGTVLWALGGQFVRVLQWSPLRSLGRISYSVYLIHTTIQLVLKIYLHNVWLVAAITIPLALLYSALSWRFMERPILYGIEPSRSQRGFALDEETATNL